MRIITEQDYYSLKVVGYVSNLHLDVLNVLYKPFIGVVSASLYETLYATRNHNHEGLTSHQFLLLQLGINKDQLSTALSTLEAVGLLTTNEKPSANYIEYVYHLNAPKDPVAFNNDAIFMHLLESAVTPKIAQDLLLLFKLDYLDPKISDVSTSFHEVFGQHLLTINHEQTAQVLTNSVAEVITPFDVNLFFNLLPRERHISPTSLSESEVKEIAQIATMFNLSESGMVEKVSQFYEMRKPFGQKLNRLALMNDLKELSPYPDLLRPFTRRKVVEVNETSSKAKLINQMETMTPYDFLQMLNHGTKVAFRDQEIIETLALDYFLSSAAINALLYHALTIFNNTLPKAAIEKLASSLSRKKLVNAIDVLDSFAKPTMRKAKNTPKEDAKKENSSDDKMSLDEIMAGLKKA